MARYQVLYWHHIPLGVRAFDIEGMVRKNLPVQFQETFQRAALQQSRQAEVPYTTSGFRWGREYEREGNASEVAAIIVNEIVEDWDYDEALTRFEKQSAQETLQFLDLKTDGDGV